MSRAARGRDLPVIPQPKGRPRRSRMAPRRALVLAAVHVVMLLHAAHYLTAGRTLSPVEPSEAMYTLELGEVNAGFVFFCLALLSTLVFGRFFCGWGCHLVALQDACAWLMKKIGVRPRPLRSRVLAWAPLVLALYMFAWPTFRRWVLDASPAPFPGFSNHLMTGDFWATFPGPVFAALTFLTCGVVAVYLLGSKGFCTYGCPYGAFFGAVDRLAPGRIVADESCEQSGHCTATCTSNVLVHREVKLHGAVTDPGCMKCMDCVSVCPNGALSFGFTRPPALGGRRPKDGPAPLTTHEELLVGATCLVATLSFRSLYDGPPLLMAVGLGAVTAYLTLTLVHLVRRPHARIQSHSLKVAGRLTRSGWLVAFVSVAWLAFTAHSAFVQWHRARGRHHLERTSVSRVAAFTGEFLGRDLGPVHETSARAAHRHFSLAERWGLVDVVEVQLGLAWTHLLRDEPEAAVARLRTAVALAPEQPGLRDDLVELLTARGRHGEAVEALREKTAAFASTARDHVRLGTLLLALERPAEAVSEFETAVRLEPGSLEARYDLGGLLRRLGRASDAVPHLEIAVDLAPADPDVRVELGLALAAVGEHAAAVEALRRAIELAPDRPESRLHLPGIIRELERRDGEPG